MKCAHYSQFFQLITKSLTPVYLISGNEILLIEEAVQAVRRMAQKQGYERTLIEAEGTDWEQALYAHIHSFSLFANKKLIELNLRLLKLNAAQGKILEAYLNNIPADTILLIVASKLEPQQEKSKWYQAIEKVGTLLTCWPITPDQLPLWIIDRAKQYQLSIDKPTAEYLAQRVEGNLLAAAQEIEKLSLLQTETLDIPTIEQCTLDDARFDIFNLLDSALLGETTRCIRILETLFNSAVEPILMLWVLTRELRMLATMKRNLLRGEKLFQIFKQFHIWEKKKLSLRVYLERHTLQNIRKCLIHAAKIDRILKGVEPGNVQNELKILTLNMAENCPFML